MFTRRVALIGAAATALMLATPALAADDLKLPRQKVELVAPPFVHAHEQATKQGPKIIEFKLTIEEKKVVVDDKGTTFQAMTFNGSMPGPLMVVHEGDADWRVRLSLRAGRPDDSLARRLRHERRRDGAAARRIERRQGRSDMTASTISASRISICRATEGQIQVL
jgi:FtsP/CotA-like multicopper oxidase with cupredoxin domain